VHREFDTAVRYAVLSTDVTTTGYGGDVGADVFSTGVPLSTGLLYALVVVFGGGSSSRMVDP